MALSKAEKAAYNDEIKDIKKEVAQINKEMGEIILRKRKLPRISGYYNLELSLREMDVIELYLKMNDLSLEMLGIKNSGFLDNARKEFYKILQFMEELAGNEVNRSLKENDEHLLAIKEVGPVEMLDFVQRMHRVFLNLRNKVGQDSKWKWSFVELQARVAVITKNLTNFSEIAKNRDPRTEFFSERKALMDMSKEWLTEAAKQYRTQYEMAGKARENLQKSINFLTALRKIHVLFGENEEAAKLKTTIDAQKQTLASEDKTKDKKSKQK